jgi:cysteine-rich repeat protein
MASMLSACVVLDPDLYKEAEQDSDGDSDTDGMTMVWDVIEDRCPFPDTKVIDSSVRVHTGVVRLNALSDDIQACGALSGFDGPDGVIGMRVAAGERVHVSAEFNTVPGAAVDPVDLGVYLMNTCDPSTCLKRVERCPAGRGEHFAWTTDQSGTYYFGFDSKAYDQNALAPELTVTVTYPRCGDQILDPGETCDDGNIMPGDGCTADCLAELTPHPNLPSMEIEPNNYYVTGNRVLATPGEIIDIGGYIGGDCDLDFFIIDVPEGGFARVTMLDHNGQECPAGTPEFELEFDDPLGVAELGKAEIPAENGGTNHCPQWDENSFITGALPAGEYVVELKAEEATEIEPFSYYLRIEVIEAPEGG